MAVDTAESEGTIDAATSLDYLRLVVAALAGLVALCLLVVGTVAVIAELKGTWHWAIHLESTISFMGVFVSRLLALLVPAFLLLVVGRQVVDDA